MVPVRGIILDHSEVALATAALSSVRGSEDTLHSRRIEVIQDVSIEMRQGESTASAYVTIQLAGAVESDQINLDPFPCDDRCQAEHAANLLTNYFLCLMIDAAANATDRFSRIRIGADEAEVVFSLTSGGETVLRELKVRVHGVDDWKQACSAAARAMAEAARETAKRRESLTVAALRAYQDRGSASPLLKAALARAWT